MAYLKENVGQLGENLAAQYLSQRDFRILERNFKVFSKKQLGEIDLIAEKDGVLYFFEVKTRTSNNWQEILPEEAISREKIKKLQKAISFYLRQKNHLNTPHHLSCFSILINRETKAAKIKLLENIFY